MTHRWNPALAAPGAFLALFLGLAGPRAASSSPVPEFDSAARLCAAGDAAGALRLYQEFLLKNPQDRLAPVAALAAGNLQMAALHDTAAAAAAYERVLRDYPGSSWAFEAARRKAACAEAEKTWERAAAAYEEALSAGRALAGDVPPQRMSALAASAARCYEKTGDPSKVEQFYQRILKEGPSPEVAADALSRLAASEEGRGEEEKAAADYVRIIESYPTAPAWARALARRELVDRHRKFDWDPYLAYAEGTKLIGGKNYAAALETCRRALGPPASPALRECAEYRQIALEAALAGDYTEGCRRLRDYLVRYPQGLRSAMARNTLATSWSEIAELEGRIKTQPEDAALLAALGERYLSVENSAKASELLQHACRLRPDEGSYRLSLGHAYAAAHRPEEAVGCYQTYIEKNPDDAEALNLIGYALIGGGAPEQALPFFQRYAAKMPGDANAHDSLAEGYLRAGKPAEAQAEYEKAVALDADFSNSYLMLGRIYSRTNQKDKALTAYERYLDLVAPGPEAEQARAAADSLRGPADSGKTPADSPQGPAGSEGGKRP